jgi:hypothetical protein
MTQLAADTLNATEHSQKSCDFLSEKSQTDPSLSQMPKHKSPESSSHHSSQEYQNQDSLGKNQKSLKKNQKKSNTQTSSSYPLVKKSKTSAGPLTEDEKRRITLEKNRQAGKTFKKIVK